MSVCSVISAVDNNLLPKNPFDSINRLILENSIYNLKIPNFNSILDFSTELNLINSNSQIELNRYLYPNSALHNVFFNYGVAKKLNIPFYVKTNEKNLHLIKKQPKTIDEMILLK